MDMNGAKAHRYSHELMIYCLADGIGVLTEHSSGSARPGLFPNMDRVLGSSRGFWGQPMSSMSDVESSA